MGFLKWLFKGRKKEETVEKKTDEEKIADSAFLKVKSHLIDMQNSLSSPNVDVKKEKRDLSKLLGDYTHLNRKQRKNLSGLFKTTEEKIERLERAA
ncbi:MAG: hypothetical protein V3V78_03600 [Candidatus Woesearchaeota archaeon]